MRRLIRALATAALLLTAGVGAARAQEPCPRDSVAVWFAPPTLNCHGSWLEPVGEGPCYLYCYRNDCTGWYEWDHSAGRGLLDIISGTSRLNGVLLQADRFTATHVGEPGTAQLQARLAITLHFIGTHGGGLSGSGQVRVGIQSLGEPVEWDPGPITVAAGQALDLTAELVAPAVPLAAGTSFDLRWSLAQRDILGDLTLSAQLKFVEASGIPVELASCRGFAGVVPVRPTTWSSLKAMYR